MKLRISYNRLDENAIVHNMRVNNTSVLVVWTMLTSTGGGFTSDEDRPDSVETVIPGRGRTPLLSPHRPEIPSSEGSGHEPERPVDPQPVPPIPAPCAAAGKHRNQLQSVHKQKSELATLCLPTIPNSYFCTISSSYISHL